MEKILTGENSKADSIPAGKKKKALLAVAWVSVLWGTTWLAAREGVKDMPALQMAGIRQVIGGVIYIIFFLFKNQPLPKGRQWIVIVVLCILNFMLGNGLSTWGVKYISSGLGSIISAIFPLWLVIIILFSGKRIPAEALTGLLLGFAGICIIFCDYLKDLLNPDFRFGIFISLTATFAWAVGSLYTKEQAENFNPYFSLGFQMFISGITLLLISHFSNNEINISKIPPASWWAIGYLTVFGSVTTFVAYVYSLRYLPVTLASVYAYINPIIAVLLGVAVLNEKFSIVIAIGGVVTLIGVYLINRGLNKKYS